MSIITVRDPEPKQQLPAAQPLTPMGMLQVAVERGADINVLEKLMDLQERYERNQGRKAFDAAIAAAKQEIPVISKNRKVDFTTAKGRTNYVYEDLGEIAETVDPILTRHGLSYRYRSTQEGGRLTVTCIISHRDGHSEETSLTGGNDDSGNKNSLQSIGSAATYLQRYTLKLALGLAAARDDDAKASVAVAKITQEQVDHLVDLAGDVGADRAAFCKYVTQAWKVEVSSFGDIPADKFDRAVAALEKKRGTI